jgi:hypothetical protein
MIRLSNALRIVGIIGTVLGIATVLLPNLAASVDGAESAPRLSSPLTIAFVSRLPSPPGPRVPTSD